VEQPVKILIADDDAVCCEILRDAIQGEGVEIQLAADGTEALERIYEKPYDILITDLNMPRMDGLTLLRNARQWQPEILAIIISGYASLDSAIEAIHQGAYDYIQKPFKIEEIKVPVRNAIEKVRVLRERANLLQELQAAYQKLKRLEAELHQWQTGESENSDKESPMSSYFLFPGATIPLFDTPKKDPDNVLVALERLRELKRSQVIDEDEFERLKKMFLNKTESKT
jgi:YesN/AraC family two-component response regulator